VLLIKHRQKQDWNLQAFIKLCFYIDQMTMYWFHTKLYPTFYNKLAPMAKIIPAAGLNGECIAQQRQITSRSDGARVFTHTESSLVLLHIATTRLARGKMCDTTNGMCAINSIYSPVARKSNIIRWWWHTWCGLYCCLLPQCEALRVCPSCLLIATAWTGDSPVCCTRSLNTAFS